MPCVPCSPQCNLNTFEKGLPCSAQCERTLSAQVCELVTHAEPARIYQHEQKQSKREQLQLATIRLVTCCELGHGWDTALSFSLNASP